MWAFTKTLNRDVKDAAIFCFVNLKVFLIEDTWSKTGTFATSDLDASFNYNVEKIIIKVSMNHYWNIFCYKMRKKIRLILILSQILTVIWVV